MQFVLLNHEYFDDNTEVIVKKGLNWWSEFIIWTKKICKLKGTLSVLPYPPKKYVPFSVKISVRCGQKLVLLTFEVCINNFYIEYLSFR